MPDSNHKPARFPRLRALLFLLLSLAFGAALIVAMTWFVIGSAPRSQAVAMKEDVSVSEFASLPDDEAYPAALTIQADGALYTGSYQTGALWSISPTGDVREIEGSRERIGSVSGLDVAPDGALYILDRIAPLDAKGAVVRRLANGELASLFAIPYESLPGGALPDDIAVDSRSRIYISDRLGRVLRYGQDGEIMGRHGEPYWWSPPCGDKCEITGIAYDRANDALLIADPAAETVYQVEITDGRPGDERSVLPPAAQKNDYGFDGIAVTPNGRIYIALLNWNRVARINNGELTMLATNFRGASDIAFDPARNRLYVTNWNQFSLAFGTRPQLPFAIDVIQFETPSH
jgi:sugar lactone lactonase YvrE